MPRPPRGHVAAVLVSAVVASACTGQTRTAPASRRSSPASRPDAVTFDRRGGDVWAWTKTVTGRTRCGDVSLEVDGLRSATPVETTGTAFRATVTLAPGRNEVVAVCDGGDAARSRPLVLDARLPVRPTARVDVTVDRGTVVLDARRSDATEPDESPVVGYEWSRVPDRPAPGRTARGERFTTARGRRLRLAAPERDGGYYVRLEVRDDRGRSDTSTAYFEVRGGKPRRVDTMDEHPAWIDRAVVYAPIPQLWGDGGPRAVERRLPYLRKLGVDALWLWPPATERATGEEYAITDYFALDPSWGTQAEFRSMVDEAHRLGMHVLLDFVPNHMSNQSPYFRDAVEHGEASAYWDFFDRRPDGRPTHYFDWTHLPNLEYDNAEVRNMVVEAFSYWVRDVGIDGFRVDAAWGVKRRRPGFWRTWRRELKRVDPDLLLIAEAPAVDPYYFSNGFDVAYDWTHHPGQWAWTSAFDFPEETGALLEARIDNDPRGYARDAVVMRFLNNNDTGARFVDRYGPETTRVAATLQFTLPGMPAMFAGDEIGASYEPYSNLTPVAWRDRFGLRPLYRRLIRLKARVPALRSGDVDVLDAEPGSALAYVRPRAGGSGPVLVVLNFGSKARVDVSRSGALDAALSRSGGRMRDLVTGARVRLDAGRAALSLRMDAQSSLVLAPERD